MAANWLPASIDFTVRRQRQPEIAEPRAKRLFDLLGAACLLVLLSPLLAAIAAGLTLMRDGPVLFRQQRAGAGGRLFWLYKFRTMCHRPQAAFRQAVPDDPRVTRLGRWLRATSLDELPQLYNVLRGDMSLVGPRPHAPETAIGSLRFAEALGHYRARELVRPGITGLAQIRGQRGPTPTLASLEARLASDLEYIERRSLALDVAILLRSLPVLFGR
jgi:lipopolysaccharide/colanic/teichoic acid biosynthesis glycosyltransferase